MTFLKRIINGLRALVWRHEAEQELDTELGTVQAAHSMGMAYPGASLLGSWHGSLTWECCTATCFVAPVAHGSALRARAPHVISPCHVPLPQV